MSTMTTPREIRSPHNGAVPRVDSPAAPARAGARIPVTQRIAKVKASAAAGMSSWWAWTAEPESLAATWAASRVAAKRIPGGSRLLAALWHLSNSTDRLVLFALLLITPTGLQGPLRFFAKRPTRRWGLYLVIAALALTYLLGRS